MKNILTREQYLDTLRAQRYTKYTGIPKSNEAFSNDVQWGDSWVGRLVNSFARKVKISVNLKRIDSLAKQLDSLFKQLYETGKIVCDEGLKKFLETKSLLDGLADKVNAKENVEILISEIDLIITQVSSYNLENKELLIKKLQEFKDYLSGLSGSVEKEKEEVETPIDVDKDDSVFESSKSLLQSVVEICDVIKKIPALKPGEKYPALPAAKGSSIEPEKDTSVKKMIGTGLDNKSGSNTSNSKSKSRIDLLNSKISAAEEHLSKMKSDDPNRKIAETELSNMKGVRDKIQAKLNADKSNRLKEKVDKWKKENDGKEPDAATKKKLEVESSNESILFIEGIYDYIVESDIVKYNNINKIAWKKVVDSYNKSGISKYVDQIRELLKTSDKEVIISICDNVKKSIKPMSYEQLIKEQASVETLAYSVSTFGGVLLAYNEELISNLGDVSSSVKKFIDSFNSIKPTSKVEFKSGEKVQYKRKNGDIQQKEIKRIDRDKVFFVDKDGKEFSKNKSEVSKIKESILIKEATEGVSYEDIESKFNEIFTDEVKDMFMIDESAKKNIEKAGEEGDKFIITNADPIIQIARLFNRAWRIHTPGRIPSGRTGGKVSSLVFSEYENLGEGSGEPDNPGNGPYRNIELYEKWQEAVLAILGNADYRVTIFSDDAVFYFGGKDANGTYKEKVSKITIAKEYRLDSRAMEKTKPLGKVLVRFINSLLSDTQMYRKGGALPKFINEYFGISGDYIENIGGLSFKGYDDVEKNDKIAKGIKPAIVVEFRKSNPREIKESIISDSKNLVIRLEADDKSTRYLYFIKTIEKYSYFYMFDKYNFDPIFTKPPFQIRKPSFIYLIRCDKNSPIGGEFKFEKVLNFMDPKDTGSKDIVFKAEKTEILVKKENGEVCLDSKLDKGCDNKYKMSHILKGYNSKL